MADNDLFQSPPIDMVHSLTDRQNNEVPAFLHVKTHLIMPLRRLSISLPSSPELRNLSLVILRPPFSRYACTSGGGTFRARYVYRPRCSRHRIYPVLSTKTFHIHSHQLWSPNNGPARTQNAEQDPAIHQSCLFFVTGSSH